MKSDDSQCLTCSVVTYQHRIKYPTREVPFGNIKTEEKH